MTFAVTRGLLFLTLAHPSEKPLVIFRCLTPDPLFLPLLQRVTALARVERDELVRDESIDDEARQKDLDETERQQGQRARAQAGKG